MERKSLAERLKELAEEKEEVARDPLYVTLAKKVEQGRTVRLDDLELLADALQALPIVFYQKTDANIEDLSEDTFLYGGFPSGRYVITVMKKQIDASHLSQGELSKRLNVAPSTISMFFAGQRTLNLAIIEQMTEILGLIPLYFVPKLVGKPPMRLRRELFEGAIATLEAYLIEPTTRFSKGDAYDAVTYGAKIAELTTALRVRWSVLERYTKS